MPQIVTLAEVTESQFTQLFDQFEGNLEHVIEAAEEWVIGYLRWNPVHNSTQTEIQPLVSSTIFFKDYPINSLTTLEISWNYSGPWTVIPTTNFFTDINAGYINTYNLGTGKYVRLTYDKGYVEIPQAIKQAVIIKTALLAAPDYEIFGSGDSKEPGLGHYEITIRGLLSSYVRKAIGS